MIELVIVSRLLEYPDAALWQHQQEMFEALASSEKLSKEDAHALGVFLRDLVAQDPLDAQAAYSELFDRGRATSLLLFEHVHGESRDRGQAMVDLMAQYERHGLLLDSHELPDHLPLYLEYLAQLPEAVLDDPELAHPDEVVFAAPAGSVMIYNAHAWHGGTRNRVGSRRRVLHGLYIDRADTAQQDQQRWLTPETASRLTPAQKWLLGVA